MTIWIEDNGRQFFGHEWIISSERHDGISYTADSVEEAIEKYERDTRSTADNVILDGRTYTKIYGGAK